MKTPPRSLTLIHIDDDYHKRRDSAHLRYLQLVPISGWDDCLLFWRTSPNSPEVDLIVSDLLFEGDTGTPLAEIQTVNGHKPIGTGVAHLKLFAVLARSGNRPLGIAMHSKYEEYWSNLLRSTDPVGRAMGLRMAHDSGELAAILGEPIQQGRDNETTAVNCLTWLVSNSSRDFSLAKRHAIQNWRREAIKMANPPEGEKRFFLMPQEYTKQLSWLDRMREKPGPINSQSLIFTKANGTSDNILLNSIFCDIVDIDSIPMKPECFDYNCFPAPNREADRIARLDHSLRPQIGAFIYAMGSMARVFHKAVEIIELFPSSPGEDAASSGLDLRNHTLDFADKSEVQGLAMLLQIVRMERFSYLTWQDVITRYSNYIDLSRCFSLEKTNLTIYESLRNLAIDCRIMNETWFSSKDMRNYLKDKLKNTEESSFPGLDWQLDQLVDVGFLIDQSDNFEFRYENACQEQGVFIDDNKDNLSSLTEGVKKLEKSGGLESPEEKKKEKLLANIRNCEREILQNEEPPKKLYCVVASTAEEIDIRKFPVPKTLPGGTPARDSFLIRNQTISTLIRTLGYPKSSDSSLSKAMASLVGSKDDNLGTALRDSLFDPDKNAPKWLLELLQEYAESNLNWPRSHGWPAWLKGVECSGD